MQKRSWGLSLLAAVPVVGVAVASTLLTDAKADWYTALQMPPLQPPGFVFSIAWSAIYLMCALALVLAVRAGVRFPKTLTVALCANGVLNTLWCAVVFQMRNIEGGVFVLLLLVLSLLFIVEGFSRLHRPAMWLFVPYLLWSGFALYLNIALTQLN